MTLSKNQPKSGPQHSVSENPTKRTGRPDGMGQEERGYEHSSRVRTRLIALARRSIPRGYGAGFSPWRSRAAPTRSEWETISSRLGKGRAGRSQD